MFVTRFFFRIVGAHHNLPKLPRLWHDRDGQTSDSPVLQGPHCSAYPTDRRCLWVSRFVGDPFGLIEWRQWSPKLPSLFGEGRAIPSSYQDTTSIPCVSETPARGYPLGHSSRIWPCRSTRFFRGDASIWPEGPSDVVSPPRTGDPRPNLRVLQQAFTPKINAA